MKKKKTKNNYSEKAPDCRVNFAGCITHKYLLPNPQSCQYVFTLNNLDLGHHFVLHLFQCVLSCRSISVQAKCLVFPLRPGQFPASVSQNKTSYKQRLFPARHCIVGTKACRYLKFPTLETMSKVFSQLLSRVISPKHLKSFSFRRTREKIKTHTQTPLPVL